MLIGGTKITPLVGTTRRLVDCGRPLHPVPDEELFDGLEDDINRVAGLEGPWYAVVMLGNGQGKCGGIAETSRRPPDAVLERMVDLAVMLNREAHHNGHWVVQWVNGCMGAFWRARVAHALEDRHSRLMIEIVYDEPWSRASQWSLHELVERAEGAYAAAIGSYQQH